MKDDTISRQLVTNLVHLTILEFMDICADSEEEPMTEKNKLLLEVNKKICTRIKELPSAQPEVAKDTNVPSNDCISRQAAIKAIEDLTDCYNGFSDTYDKACIIGVLEELPSTQPTTCEYWDDESDFCALQRPSAQPEIIHCRECKYGEQDEYERWYCNGFGCQVGDEDGSGFCADAERREDEDKKHYAG